LFVETRQDTGIKSIYKTNLKKKYFPTRKERNQYISKTGITRLFENLKCDQQFLIDSFYKVNDTPEFNANPLKIWFLDIETYSPDHFPEPDEARDPINVITIYDSLAKKYFTWGTKPITKTIENTEYVHCTTERSMLECFLNYMEADYPDIFSGWNSEFFDMPYLIKRTCNVLGEQYARRFSPVRNIFSTRVTNQYQTEQTKWYISGVSCIDYMNIYKKFSMGDRDSYSLNAIADAEIGETKIDYGDSNLSELADIDWQTFVEYNVQDVSLLVKMEEKLQYIALLRMLAYTGLTSFEGAVGTIGVVTGACAIKSRQNDTYIPTFVREDDVGKFEGGHVGEPLGGFQQHIISFDANSLYPNTMISLNLSPETKVGKIIEKNDTHITVAHVNNKTYKLTHDKFVEFVKKEDIAISRANVMFTQKYKGMLPIVVDELYQKRVEYKGRLTKAKKRLEEIDENHKDYAALKHEKEQMHIKQYTVKILINAMYGYFGNKYAPMGDVDLARSITLTGQAVIKQSNTILEQYIKDVTGKEKLDFDPIIYNDTDSSYISIRELIEHFGVTYEIDGDVQPEVYKICEDVEDNLNAGINKWAANILNSKDSRFKFKRETICDTGMFLAKKRYVLRVLDDEGFKVNKFKYTGVEVVRTTMPKAIKPYVKKIVETMMETQDETLTNDAFVETFDIFKGLDPKEYAMGSGIKNYDKWASQCNGFTCCKGIPHHVKASYYYNYLLEKLELTAKHEKIASGDKIRMFHLNMPNKYNIKKIAYKDHFPAEFEQFFTVDYEMMFEKIIYNTIERFYKRAGWILRKPNEQIKTDLFAMFG